MTLDEKIEAAKQQVVEAVVDAHHGLDLVRIFDPRTPDLTLVEKFVLHRCPTNRHGDRHSVWLAEFRDAMNEAFDAGREVERAK